LIDAVFGKDLSDDLALERSDFIPLLLSIAEQRHEPDTLSSPSMRLFRRMKAARADAQFAPESLN
jgi:hypothetical protein